MMFAAEVSVISGLSMIAVAGFSTYLFRSGVILFIGNRPLPYRLVRTLKSVAPAVLAALIVSTIAGSEGASGIEISELAAIAVGGGAARLSKNLLVGLVAGMSVFYILEALI